MKCFIVGPAFPLRGGIANFNEALAAAVKDRGIECSIISFSMQYPGFLFPGKTQVETGEPPAGISIYTMISSVNPYTWFRTAAFIRKEKPDFIIVRYWLPFMAPCLGTIARLVRKHCRVIAVTDNIIPHESRPGDKLLTGYFVSSCDAFVAMSKAVLNDLDKFTLTKDRFFSPHPVYDIFGEPVSKQHARQVLGLDQHARYILFFGFIRKYKGLDILLEALADEALKQLKVNLVIAGEFYDDEKEYRTLIRKHNLDDRVIVRSAFIPKEGVKHYFCAADMVVQTYREATQSGITQVAYHFNRPMLVTRVGGLAEIVEDGKVGYVTDVNPGSVAVAISDFYHHQREETFAANVKEDKKKFSWDGFVNVILEALK